MRQHRCASALMPLPQIHQQCSRLSSVKNCGVSVTCRNQRQRHFLQRFMRPALTAHTGLKWRLAKVRLSCGNLLTANRSGYQMTIIKEDALVLGPYQSPRHSSSTAVTDSHQHSGIRFPAEAHAQSSGSLVYCAHQFRHGKPPA